MVLAILETQMMGMLLNSSYNYIFLQHGSLYVSEIAPTLYILYISTLFLQLVYKVQFCMCTGLHGSSFFRKVLEDVISPLSYIQRSIE